MLLVHLLLQKKLLTEPYPYIILIKDINEGVSKLDLEIMTSTQKQNCFPTGISKNTQLLKVNIYQ